MKKIIPLLGSLILCIGACSVRAQSLISWWQFESNLDDSISTNNGTVIQQISYIPGESGEAWDITGAIIEIPDSPSLDPSTNITVQAWVNSTNPGGGYRYILSKSYGSGGVSYALYTGGGGAVFFVNLIGGTTVLSPAAAPSSVWDGNWHQLTGVYDGSTSHLYLDGAEVAPGTTTTSTNAIIYTPPNQLIFGDYQVARGLPYSGDLDEVKIFDGALSSNDVLNTFQDSSSPAATNGLVSWYRAEGNANDSWGTNNGVVVASTLSYAPGENGTALLGQGGRATVPETPALEPATVTVQAWVNSFNPAAYRYIAGKSRGSGGLSYALYTGGGSGAVFYINVASGGGTFLSQSPVPLAVWDGAWHQLTGIFDGTNVALYLDGLQVSTNTPVTNAGGIDYSSPGPLVFCDYQAAGGLPFIGMVDDLKVYNGAMTASQVLASYETNLVSWWIADTNASDSIGTNNGTLTGNAGYGLGRVNGFSFETEGGSVQIPDSPSLQIASGLTLEAQASAVSPGANKYLIAKSDTPSSASYGFTTGPSGGLQFFVTTSSGTIRSPDGGTNIWDGNFHVIDGTYDGTKVALYVDGSQAGSGTTANGSIQYGTTENSGALIFGDFSGSLSSSNFPGALAQIKLYRTALSGYSTTLDVPKNALLYAQPQSPSALLGHNAVFSGSFQMSAYPNYQWQFDGTNIPGATNSSLTVQAQASTVGSYTIVASNGTMQYVPGVSGLAFDTSSGGMFRVNDAFDTFDLQAFTFQAWVRATNVGDYKYVFSKSRDPSYYSSSYGLYTSYSGAATFFVVLQGPSIEPTDYGFVTVTNNSGTGIWDGNWHQFTGTWDGEFLSLYVDGQLNGTVDSFGGTIDMEHYFLDGDLLVGDVLDPPSIYHFPGQIDEVKMFNFAMSADDAAETFTNSTSTAATNGLIGWWKGEGNALDSWSTNNGEILLPPSSVTSAIATLIISYSPPALSGPALNTTLGTFQATVTGPTGSTYVVQRTYDLAAGDWTPIATNVVPFTFTNSPGVSEAAFYRVVSQ